MVIPWLSVMISLCEIGSDGTAYERSRCKMNRKSCHVSVSACSAVCWTEHETERTSWKRSSSMETSKPQRSEKKTESERFVWDMLNAVVGAPWKPTTRVQRDGDEVPAARYPIAAGGGEEPLPVQPAVRGGQGGVLGTQSPHPRRRGHRGVRNDSRLPDAQTTSEMWSDPDQCKRMMLRTISLVQLERVTGTEISQVSVKCRWSAKHTEHLRKE